MNKQSKIDPSQTKALKINPYTNNKTKQETDYFTTYPGREANRAVSEQTSLKMCDKFSDVFTGTECFKGTFFLQVKDDAKPYHVLLRHLAYALKEAFKKK